jgi:hypothetical protein
MMMSNCRCLMDVYQCDECFNVMMWRYGTWFMTKGVLTLIRLHIQFSLENE